MADETMTDEQILEDVEHKSFVATSDRTAASLSASGVAAEDVARAAAQAAYDKKGEDVQVLDLTELSDVCDYFVLATGTNNRQVDRRRDRGEGRRGLRRAPVLHRGPRAEDLDAHGLRLGRHPRLHPRGTRLLPPREALGRRSPAPPRPPLGPYLSRGFSRATLYRSPGSCTSCSCPASFCPKVANLGRGFFSYYLPFAEGKDLRFIA